MVTIYNDMKSADSPATEFSNDLFFNEFRFTSNFNYKDPTVSKLIREIDGGVLIDSHNFLAKNGDLISLSYLSTGCKTALSIYFNPDKWFDAVECGNNALVEILKLNHGKVVMYRKPYCEENFDLDVELITSQGTYHCTDFMECDYYWEGDM